MLVLINNKTEVIAAFIFELGIYTVAALVNAMCDNWYIAISIIAIRYIIFIKQVISDLKAEIPDQALKNVQKEINAAIKEVNKKKYYYPQKIDFIYFNGIKGVILKSILIVILIITLDTYIKNKEILGSFILYSICFFGMYTATHTYSYRTLVLKNRKV